MASVFVIDDHELIREGLKVILGKQPGLKIVGDAATSRRFFSSISGSPPDIVLLDITLRDENGLDILKEIKKRLPATRILILSMHSEESFVLRALRAGAAGYVDKQKASNELVRAIRKVLNGERYVTKEIEQRLLADMSFDKPRASHETLTDREFQVLRLIAAGRSSGEIANELRVSVSTITTHRSKILKKMRVRTTAEIVQYALRHDLI